MEIPPRKGFTRRHFVRTLGLGAVGSLAYARWVEPHQLSITQKEVPIPGLPAALDGTLIAHLTDFHYQPDDQDQLMQQAVAAVNAARPDLVCLTGDFITDSPRVLSPLMEHLGRLEAKHGVYGVMGNHDGWHAPYSLFQNAFRRAGHEFLINDRSRIQIRGEAIHILGTDSVWSGSLDLTSCYRGHLPQEPVLALVHEPDVFDRIRSNHRVDLQLSGHTHGGQCRVPVVGYAPVKVRYGQKYIYGGYSRQDARIFVSRGLGTVGTQVRFACPPEVALLTLRAQG